MLFNTRQAKADYRAAITSSQWLSTASEREIERRQWQAVRRVWADCIANIVYYQRLVDSNLAPRELRTWEDLRAIPILDRSTLQARESEFQRMSHPDEIRMTGGSTGTPVRVGVWTSEARVHRIAKLILWQQRGYNLGDRLFLLWGHLHLLGTGMRGKLNHVIRKLKDWALDYKRVDAYSLSPEKSALIARELLDFKPVGLIGYASALDYFIRTTEPFHEAFGKLGLGFVLAAGEMPPRPDSYELLERVFKCPVIEEFAGVEFGQVAMRDGSSKFKVFDDLNYVEAEPLGDSLGSERILVTSLYDRYVPLIRYAVGDVIFGARRLPHGHVTEFDRIGGRVHDTVKLPGGKVVHSMAVFHCIHQENGVLNIQMVLRDDGPRLRLAVRPSFDGGAESRIRERLGQVAAELRDIPIERGVDVATTRAGKRRWISDERSTRG